MEIFTHSGPFHADDVFAVGIIYENVHELNVTRTRDKQLLDEAAGRNALLVDVGGAYDGDTLFDHHYVGAPVREDGTPYASAGLVARTFNTDADVDDLCRQIDLADNGIRQEGWSLSMTVHQCNPLKGGAEEFDYRFNYLYKLAAKAINMCRLGGVAEAVEFFESDPTVGIWIKEYSQALAASETRVREAFKQSGAVVELGQYEQALMEIGHEAPVGKLYSIFPNPGGEWMVQQIPQALKSPKGRKPLPEEWAGKRGAELDAVTGLQDCVFCHPARFIGGNKTLDGARQMAELAVTS